MLADHKVMGAQALTLPDALATYQRFVSLPQIGFRAKSADCANQLKRRLAVNLPARLPTDAHLAAFAESAGLRMVTFDKNLGRFKYLECL